MEGNSVQRDDLTILDAEISDIEQSIHALCSAT
jgi:hypothetical protein